jgi:rhamnulokinase
MNYYLAIDIGASSGRHILGSVKDGKITTEEIYRFKNGIIIKNGKRCWDVVSLFKNIIAGLKKCKECGKIPATVGIDTWGVDFVLLDSNEKIIGDTVSYRDHRTDGMNEKVEKIISENDLYERTGIQKQIFNTIYQLEAVKCDNNEELNKAESILMMPEYLNYRLTGKKVHEYTNATTTGLVNVNTREWDTELTDMLGFPHKLFNDRLSLPGTSVGKLSREIAEEIGYDAEVILPATHDTGSAFLSIPALNDDAVYISSGTWSLLGMENKMPIITDVSRKNGFTNEGGYKYRYRFLKNIMGLWMIQSVKHELNDEYDFSKLEELARENEDFTSTIDANSERFLSPSRMIDEVKRYCNDTHQKEPQNTGEIMQCLYRSLAQSYGESIKMLEQITGRHFQQINIVGGGSKDSYLNELTSDVTGLPVMAGPSEGTALGNLIVQFIGGKEFKDLTEARRSIIESFKIIKYAGGQNEQI